MRSTRPWRGSRGSPPSVREPLLGTLAYLLFKPHPLSSSPRAPSPGVCPNSTKRRRRGTGEEEEGPESEKEPSAGAAAAAVKTNRDAGPGGTRDHDVKPELRRRRRRLNGGLLRKTDAAAEPGRVPRPRRRCRRPPHQAADPRDRPRPRAVLRAVGPRKRRRRHQAGAGRADLLRRREPRARTASSSPTVGTATYCSVDPRSGEALGGL